MGKAQGKFCEDKYIDGAFNKDSGICGWGYIIRDRSAEFVAAGAGKSCHLHDPLHAQTVACLAAVDGPLGVNLLSLPNPESPLNPHFHLFLFLKKILLLKLLH
jgi:hypothetical protein